MWTTDKEKAARYLNKQVTIEVGRRVWAAYVKRYPDERWRCDLRVEGNILAMYEDGVFQCYYASRWS